MARVLVTGASGFIGRALVTALQAAGFEVTVALRRPADSPQDTAAVRTIIVGEIDASTDWRAALEGVTHVVHLAGIAHQPIAEDVATVVRYYAVNVNATAGLARAAAAAGVTRLVFLSSIKVNGEETGARPYTEADLPAPQDIYGRSKWQAEQTLADIARQTGLAVTVLRSPLVYGPGVGGNFASLLRLCDTSVPLPFGAIDNRRSLIARTNLVDAIIACLDHPAAAGETFLLRDGEDLSTAELVRRLRRALERPARLVPVPPKLLMDLARFVGRGKTARRLIGSLTVDDGKLRTMLDWQPPQTVEEALAETARALHPGRIREP
jgi:nucleoside-diphosphate-sugar epimerase